MAEPANEGRRRVTLELTLKRIAHIDAIKREWGMRNRGDVLERLLDDIFGDGDDPDAEAALETRPSATAAELDRPTSAPVPSEASSAGRIDHQEVLPTETSASGGPSSGGSSSAGSVVEQASIFDTIQTVVERLDDDLDDHAALVLIGRGSLEALDAEFETDWGTIGAAEQPPRGGGGIDLPGFVRRRSVELKRSFRTSSGPAAAAAEAVLPQLCADDVTQALAAATEHWVGLYGTAANATVLEAAMVWLGKDIWPQCDQGESRSFTWSSACRLMQEWVAGWSDDPPTFERVMVTAGVLEDPFSGSTLTVRIPTIIRRFVQRFRRRRKGSSFQTLQHTMTLQGALKLLQLPTDPGHRVTLGQIREAYRELALSHHPDSGGSVEEMRRLNEAYQLLKELYRQAPELQR